MNVVGTANVLTAAPGAQVIFASSGGAGYGECPEPADEETPFLPLSPYGIAKKCGEEYLAGWNRIHGTSHVSLRFANVYGPRQDAGLEGGVVAIFLERLARGDETVIYGDGEQCRDFVYVADIVAALLAAAGRSGGPYNVGTGVGTSVAGLLAACAAVAGSDAEPAARSGAPGRCPAFDSRPVADRARARLARRGVARRRSRANLDLDEGSSGGVAKSSGAMDAPLPAPELLIRPWRTATLVASLVAAVELVLLWSQPCSSWQSRSPTQCSGTPRQPPSHTEETREDRAARQAAGCEGTAHAGEDERLGAERQRPLGSGRVRSRQAPLRGLPRARHRECESHRLRDHRRHVPLGFPRRRGAPRARARA